MGSFDITVDLDDALAGLDRITAAAKRASRPAAQAGADVFYREVRRRAPEKDGVLRRAIYQVFSADASDADEGLSTYHVSWNRRKAPHGHLVEFGHKMPFKVIRTSSGQFFTDKSQPSDNPNEIVGRAPFLRPSYDAMRPMALQAARARFVDEMQAALLELDT